MIIKQQVSHTTSKVYEPPEERIIHVRRRVVEVCNVHEAGVLVVLQDLVNIGVNSSSVVEEDARNTDLPDQL